MCSQKKGRLLILASDRLAKILKYAVLYCRLRMAVIPIPKGSKKPCLHDWQHIRLTAEEVPQVFDGAYNVAVVLGIGGLADVDADSHEAVRAAGYFLPETEWVFGRASKPSSHHIYQLCEAVPLIQLRDPLHDRMIVELRCLTKEGEIGLCTVFPPSLHEEGEEITFASGKKATAGPPITATGDIVNAVYRIGAAALFAAHWVPSGGGRHICMLALAGTLANHAWPEQEALQFCDAVYRSIADPDPAKLQRVRSEVASTYKKHYNGESITGAATLETLLQTEVVRTALGWLGITRKPALEQNLTCTAQNGASKDSNKTVIEMGGKDQEVLTEQTLQALYRANVPARIFTQLQSVVAITKDKRNNVAIKIIGTTELRHYIHRAVRFNEGGKACKIPSEVPHDILVLPTSALGFPELDSVIRGPVMRADGSVVDTPGYDSRSGLLYVEDVSLRVPGIPEMPTQEDARASADSLLHYMREFPFTDDASKANALAAMITPVVRPVIDGVVPLAIISAVSPASGKTTLGDLISIAATGSYGGYMGAPANPEEWSKRITSALRKGSPVIIIDNVKETQPLDSPDLCRLITDREWADRELQFSREIRIPNRALWIATGNNLKVGGDMGTRCFLIKLDAGPDPSSRKFSTDTPHEFWKGERGRMLAAILTLARAWFVAGCPRPKSSPQTRFAEWVRVVGGILEHGGVSGFLNNYEELRASTDRESMEWENFHATLRSLFTGPFQIRSLLVKFDANPELKDALPKSLRSLANKPDTLAMALGNEYSARENRPYGPRGIKVVRAGIGHAGAMKWQIVTSE